MLPGIGSRLAEKIVEIMETGSMIKLEEYQTDTDIAAMDLFGQIWGIGPAQAKRWVDLVCYCFFVHCFIIFYFSNK